jgi:outer membrane protein assembly factor BamB
MRSPEAKTQWFDKSIGMTLSRGPGVGPAKLELRPWQWRDQNAVGAPPQSFANLHFVDENRVLIPSLGGGLAFVDLRKNQKIWEKEYPVGVAADVFYRDGFVYVATMDASVHKIQIETGKVEWTAKVSAESTGGVGASDKMLYVTASDNSLWALDIASGQALWTYKRPNTGSPVLWSLRGAAVPRLGPDQKTIYVGFSDAVFVALKADTGDTVWERSFDRAGRFKDADTTAVLSKDGSKIFLSVVDFELHAIDAATGRSLWSLPSASHYPPVIDEKEGSLYHSTADNKLRKVTLKAGSIQWSVDLGPKGMASTPVLLDDGHIVFSTTRFGLMLLSRSTGSLLYEDYLGQGTLAPPSYFGSTLLILGPRNDLRIYRWRGAPKRS